MSPNILIAQTVFSLTYRNRGIQCACFVDPRQLLLSGAKPRACHLAWLPEDFVNKCCIIRTREGKCVIRNILLNQQQLLKVVDSKYYLVLFVLSFLQLTFSLEKIVFRYFGANFERYFFQDGLKIYPIYNRILSFQDIFSFSES